MNSIKEKIKDLYLNLFWYDFKRKWCEICFLLSLFFLEILAFSCVSYTFDLAIVIPIYALALAIPVFFLVLSLKKRKPSKEEIKKFLIFVLLALILGICKSYLYIMSLIVAYLFLDDKKNLYKWIFITSNIALNVFLFLVFSKIIPDTVTYRYYESSVSLRHTLGMSNTNMTFKYFLLIVISGYMWICNNKKNTLLFTITMLPLFFVIFVNTSCRTGALTIGTLLILINLPSCLFKWIKAKWLYILFVLITVLLTLSYTFNIHEINSLLSGRPYFFNLYIKTYPYNIIVGKAYGPMVANISQTPLDNDYLFTLFDGGIFALIATAILFHKGFKNNKDYKVLIPLFGTLLYGLTEALVTVNTNIIFVIIFMNLLEIKDGKVILVKEKKEL